MTDLRQKLEATYQAEGERLVRELCSRFALLGTHECEDLVQLAFTIALQDLAKPEFELRTGSWLPYLRRVSHNRAIDFIRGVAALSLNSLVRNRNADGSSDNQGWQPADASLSPSAFLRKAERAERRQVLVSDILVAFVQHVEHTGSNLRREVFERSLRGQKPAEVAIEMELDAQRVFEHRSRAFTWVRAEIERCDPGDSILKTVFFQQQEGAAGPQPLQRDTPHFPPLGLYDLIQLSVDELGGLCPSDDRLEEYCRAPQAADVSDIGYHIQTSRWYLDERPVEPGCRLCVARMETGV